MSFRPLRDMLLLKKKSQPGMIGLIHVPDVTRSSKNQTYYYAEVLAAGPKAALAKAGDTVFLSEYSGDEFELQGQKVLLTRERDIVGVVQN